MSSEIYEEYLRLVEELSRFEQTKVPLCAAETYTSPFVRSALGAAFEGKYCMQNLGYRAEEDFIGSEYVHRLYGLLARQCRKMFQSEYADARTLSGMNCLASMIHCLLPRGGRVLLTDPAQGGHPSIPLLLELAQIGYDAIPYDYEHFDLDCDALNARIRSGRYDAVIVAQSDVLIPADAARIRADGIPILYDATQTFGMIAAHVHANPLEGYGELVLLGGTHKTLPGPTCGLILTRQMHLARKIDGFVSPRYLRNTQPDHIAAVLLSLLEQEAFGKEYQLQTIENANRLAALLQGEGFDVFDIGGGAYTRTHQIFLSVSEEEKKRITEHAFAYGVTLNGKQKPLFRGHGIRLGMQEITRYGWGSEELAAVAALIAQLRQVHPDAERISKLKEKLRKKEAKYTFGSGIKE